MKIKLLETAGWYTVFKNLRQSYSLDTRSGCDFEYKYLDLISCLKYSFPCSS